MARRRRNHGTVNVRISREAAQLAEAAAALAGMTRPEWLTRLVLEHARAEVTTWAARLAQPPPGQPPQGPPPRGGRRER